MGRDTFDPNSKSALMKAANAASTAAHSHEVEAVEDDREVIAKWLEAEGAKSLADKLRRGDPWASDI